ncbi:MAG: nucleoside hydrolase [Candidatus Bathyarchaeota archaeon]|nr:MAG: nucleoside hydrolase [Candidatus Bathyarchaeota archaeon]
MVKRIILDVDTGTDDACAIMLALKSPELKIEAITSVMGNSTIEKTTRNTCKVVEIVTESRDRTHEDIPIAMGMHRPLIRSHFSHEKKGNKLKEGYHGSDGLGGLIDSGYLKPPKLKPVKQHAIDLIIAKVMENPGQITLLPVGPLTNIAIVLLKEPKVAKNIEEIIHMGGVFSLNPYGYGNITPMSEFNDWCDPEAAKIVFESGAKITAVGLDVTTFPSARITENHLRRLQPEDPVDDFIIRMCRSRIERQEGGVGAIPGTIVGANIHDALAVAVAIDRNLVETQPYYVHVVTMVPDNAPTRGMTIADKRPQTILKRKEESGFYAPNIDVCTRINGDKWTDFFIERIKA